MTNENNIVLDLNAIEAVCREIAAQEQTLIEVREYAECGWTGICFETDAFGGCYVNLHVAHDTLKVHNWYRDEKSEQEIMTVAQLRTLVHKEKKRMQKVRCTSELTDFINSQY